MYSTLIVFHSIIRWFTLLILIITIFIACRGVLKNTCSIKTHNLFRSWTVTIVHIQLILGMVLYLQSPIVKLFWKNPIVFIKNGDIIFYALLHPFFMIIGGVVLTIGAGLAKRKMIDRQKHKTIIIWFLVAFLIFLLAIPWPFSFFSQRSFFRFF